MVSNSVKIKIGRLDKRVFKFDSFVTNNGN
jgi:hypothetical protein